MYYSNSHLIIIAGPTASGKSGLAMEIAKRHPAVILSADSRQVYREFDIGTAKPSTDEQQVVTHRFIDICEPTEIFTVADYQQQAQAAIASIQSKREQLPLLVGGTGLYINSVAKGLKIPSVAPYPELRSQLTNLGQPYCYALLARVDPEATQRIHQNDQVRTLRALEVFYVTGKSISSQQGEDPPTYPILYIGLTCEADVLRSRITQRAHQMIEAGFAAEVTNLIDKYGADLPLLKTLGYAEMQQYLANDISLDQTVEQIIQHTCQFAKRQRTWFKKDPSIEWFDIEDENLVEKVDDRINEFLVSMSFQDQ